GPQRCGEDFPGGQSGTLSLGAGNCRAGVFAFALYFSCDDECHPPGGCGDSRLPGFLSMNAEIVAVGSEMLTAGRLDTNSLFITEHLNSLGIEVTAKHVIGDDRARLVTAIERALADSTILFLSGGLGPTEDDLTRDAVARAIGCTMSIDPGTLSAIEERFLRMSRKMPEINRRQAMILDGA